MESLVLAQFFINIPIIPIPFLLLVIYLSMGHVIVIIYAFFFFLLFFTAQFLSPNQLISWARGLKSQPFGSIGQYTTGYHLCYWKIESCSNLQVRTAIPRLQINICLDGVSCRLLQIYQIVLIGAMVDFALIDISASYLT